MKKQADADIEVNDYSPDQENRVTKESCYKGTFEEMDLDPSLMENLKKLQWEKPTPIHLTCSYRNVKEQGLDTLDAVWWCI